MSTLRRSIEFSIVQDIYYAEFPLSETPYIATVDADDEFITICNPRSTELHLKDYYVIDRKRLHKFVFTEDEHIVQPHGTLYLYTCPKLTMERQKSFQDPHVLWRNVDGSLRRKEVLNNEHCEMLLYAPNNKCIASCSSDRYGRHEIKRREEELHSIPSLMFSSTTRTILSLLRIVVLVAFAICSLESHPYRIFLYWGAFFLDIFSRESCNSALDDSSFSKSPLLRALNCYGDDINLFILYTTAIMQDASSSSYAASSVLHQHPSDPLVANASEDGGFPLNSVSLSSTIFKLFHVHHDTSVDSTTDGIAWFRILLILAALLEFTAITASTDHLHWRRDEDVLYRYVRTMVHPVGVTAIALGSEIYLLSFANLAQSPLWEWGWWLVLSCFLLRVINNLSMIASSISSANGIVHDREKK